MFIVVPTTYTIYQSNQYDTDSDSDRNFQSLQDDQCSSLTQGLLICTGLNSALFDGVVGRDTIDHVNEFEQTDFSRHYTWHQDITPNPRIEMSFNVPLVELLNVTLYFFRRTGGSRVNIPHVSMCFSRNQSLNPCNDIDLPNRPGGLENGVVEWVLTLLSDVTSVESLRINFQYDSNDEDEYIFLSEVRIAERRGIVVWTVYIIRCNY